MDAFLQPWPWYVAGPILAIIMVLLLYFGGYFGVSSNLRAICSMARGDKFSDFFKWDWKSQWWNLLFVVGAIIGGVIAANYLTTSENIVLNPETVTALQELGFENPGSSFLPSEIFGVESVLSLKGILILLISGFLVGFGARYAGGCTSGHAISGLSNLQLPSLIAVIGFFIGGLLMTHIFLPIIF